MLIGYDAASRLSSLSHDVAGTTHDSTTTFTYNPASQIASSTRTNDLYAWSAGVNVNRAYTANGLNQYSAVAGTSVTYDANGNLTSDGTQSYLYDVENRLVGRSGGGTSATLLYDPLGRLYNVYGSATGTTREGTGPHQMETGDDPFSELFSRTPKIVDIQGARYAGRCSRSWALSGSGSSRRLPVARQLQPAQRLACGFRRGAQGNRADDA